MTKTTIGTMTTMMKTKTKIYKCVKCGGKVVPGVNGCIRGLSSQPDGHPSGAIKDTLDAIHYAADCGEPEKITLFPKLGPIE